MKRLLLSLLLSVAGTIVLFVGAGMAGGACHCMTPMFTLFPYGSFVWMRTDWESIGMLLVLVQFPLCVIILTVVKGMRWKIVVLLFLVALHVVAASLSLRDYCQSRHTCSARARQQIVGLG